MSVNFEELLTDDQKRQILSARIEQFAAEGYQHTLNKAAAETLGNAEAVTQAEEAIEIISASITAHSAKLDELPPATA
jgi:hypothetical protein